MFLIVEILIYISMMNLFFFPHYEAKGSIREYKDNIKPYNF